MNSLISNLDSFVKFTGSFSVALYRSMRTQQLFTDTPPFAVAPTALIPALACLLQFFCSYSRISGPCATKESPRVFIAMDCAASNVLDSPNSSLFPVALAA
ncbi:hypothetical protein OG21DRAFT_642501 [Imleria badia]|nr:hypothetical protein OG21DRAFT_642501 [Imleria badia]